MEENKDKSEKLDTGTPVSENDSTECAKKSFLRLKLENFFSKLFCNFFGKLLSLQMAYRGGCFSAYYSNSLLSANVLEGAV